MSEQQTYRNQLIVRDTGDFEDVAEGGSTRIYSMVNCSVDLEKGTMEFERRNFPACPVFLLPDKKSDLQESSLPDLSELDLFDFSKTSNRPFRWTSHISEFTDIGITFEMLKEMMDAGVEVLILNKELDPCTYDFCWDYFGMDRHRPDLHR